MMARPLVIAHRGFSANYVENTLTAYRAAIAAGADLIETDARLSRDGTVWSCHDATLDRLTGDGSAIADMSDAELAKVELAQGERLTNLREVLQEIAPKRPILIDVKTDYLDLVETIVRDIKASHATEQVWIGMRDLNQLGFVRSLGPRLSLLAFLPDYEQASEFERAGASAFRIWEGDLHLESALRLLGTKNIWVTTGGRGTDHQVGDTTPADLERILLHAPAGVLLNDPTLLTGTRIAKTDAVL